MLYRRLICLRELQKESIDPSVLGVLPFRVRLPKQLRFLSGQLRLRQKIFRRHQGKNTATVLGNDLDRTDHKRYTNRLKMVK